jgi:hypothetical protein
MKGQIAVGVEISALTRDVFSELLSIILAECNSLSKALKLKSKPEPSDSCYGHKREHEVDASQDFQDRSVMSTTYLLERVPKNSTFDVSNTPFNTKIAQSKSNYKPQHASEGWRRSESSGSTLIPPEEMRMFRVVGPGARRQIEATGRTSIAMADEMASWT